MIIANAPETRGGCRKYRYIVVNGFLYLYLCLCLVFPQHYLCVIEVGNRVHYRESLNLLSLSNEQSSLVIWNITNVNSNDLEQLCTCT